MTTRTYLNSEFFKNSSIAGRKKSSSIFIILIIIFSSTIGIFSIAPNLTVSAATIYTAGTKPVSGETITGKYTFQVNDAGSASRCELRIDGTLIAYMDSTGFSNPDWQYTLDTSGWADGSHLIRYDSINGTGGTDVITIPVKFDNNGPEITNGAAVYDIGISAVAFGDKVRIKATIYDAISGIENVTCNSTLIGGSQWVAMYDDGQHLDGNAYDGTYGTDEIKVRSIPGYHSVFIWARDKKGNYNNVTVGVNVDNYEPTIMGIQTILPAGQTAIKNGDSIRVVAKAFDYKLEIINVTVRRPLDVVLVLDNSGSMAGTKWSNLESAANAFIDTLANNDRCAIYSFDLQGDRESAKRYQDFLLMDQVYTCQMCNSITDVGRNLTKHVITADDGRHLTRTNSNPECYTPIWDTIGEAIIYAQNNHLTDHVPIVIAMTDGDDAGTTWPQYEYGSETFCPGAPNGATNRTWTITGGCYWGSPVRSYSSILRERDTDLYNSFTTISFSDSTYRDGTRTGLINCTLPIFTVGLGNIPQGSNASATGYIPPNTKNYRYTTEYDLREIASSSYGGKYYYAPSGNELKEIYQKIAQEIKRFGISELGKLAPHGIHKVEADLSSIGIYQKVSMFDDGKHGDASPNDDIYGSELVTVNSVDTGNIVFSVEGTDIAGNSNYTINTIYLDNIQPVISNIIAYYPPGRSNAQDGYSIYFSAFTNDTESGLGYVYLDATNIGGSSKIPMNDAGDGNDLYAYDNIFSSKNFTVATGLKSGTYTVTIRSYDKAGNLAEHSGNIEISNDVDIIMGNIIANDVISGYYPLIVNITDPDGIPDTSTNPRYRIDANPWYDLSLISGSNFGAVINTTRYLDGERSIFVNAKDPYGAESTLETKVIIDNTPPNQAILISPITNEFIEGVYSFKSTAADAIGLKNVTLSIFNTSGYPKVKNQSMGFNTVSGYYEYVFGTANLDDGTYYATIYAHDKANHETASIQVKFFIDNTYPILILNHPDEGNIVSGIVEMNFSVSDLFFGKIEYNVDNSGWINSLIPWDTNKVKDGTHTIKIRTKDKANHLVEVTIQVIVDNHDPICVLSQPAKNQFVGGLYLLRSYASDQVGLESVIVKVYQKETTNSIAATYTEILSTTMVYNAGSGYFEHYLATNFLPDGSYKILSIAQDIAGNITYSENITFFIDNNAPELKIHYPKDGELVSGIVIFELEIDELFINYARYNIDDSGWEDISVPWNTSEVMDGEHNIEIKVLDKIGHVTSQDISVITDNNLPLCIIQAPIENQYLENTFTFRVQASDEIGIRTVELNLFYKTVNAVYNSETGYYEYTVDTRFFEDGEYNITATCIDLAKRSTVSPLVNFRIDNKHPIMQIRSPQNGIFVTGDLELDFTITDAFPCITEYNIDGNGWIPYQINPVWNSTTVLDGEHELEVRCTDPVGHTAEQRIRLFVDNNPPTCALHSPAKGQYIEGIFTFKVLAGDEVGIKYVELEVFGETVKTTYNSQTNYFEYSIALNTILDGEYDIKIKAVDKSGKVTNIGPIKILVDNNAPVLKINKPLSNDFVSKSIPIDITVSDAFPTEEYYSIDGSGWISTDISWQTTSGRDGEHLVSIRAIDSAGHITERTITVYVDNTDPRVTLILPKENDYITGIYTVKVFASDTSGIDSVQLVIDDGIKFDILQNPSTGLYEVPIDTTKLNLEDGLHTFEFEVRDKVFRLSTTSTQVFIDNTPPEIILDYPKSGGGQIYFKINATDLSGIDKVLINIDGTGWQEINTYMNDSYTHRYIWRTSRKDNGKHEFNIKAIDILGNEAKVTGELEIENKKEEDYFQSFMDILPLIAFIVFIILIIIIFMLFRRGTFQKWMRRTREAEKAKSDSSEVAGPDFGLGDEAESETDDEDFEFEFARAGVTGDKTGSGTAATQTKIGKPPSKRKLFNISWRRKEKDVGEDTSDSRKDGKIESKTDSKIGSKTDRTQILKKRMVKRRIKDRNK